MRVLLDTNILLDVLMDREPYVESSEAVWSAAALGRFEGLVAAHTVTTVYYLQRKLSGAAIAAKTVRSILTTLEAAPVNGRVLSDALAGTPGDFEDAVAAQSALHAQCEMVVTRDPKGFRQSGLRVLSPAAFLAALDRS